MQIRIFSFIEVKMGIKHFFHWFKRKFANHIYKLQQEESISSIKEESIQTDGIQIDNLMIDMNGIFHTSAQKIYRYGNYKTLPRLLTRKKSSRHGNTLQQQLI